MPETTLLGEPLTDLEQQVKAVYDQLKSLAAREDCPPCVAASARQALASMWVAVNDLGIAFEQLYDLGV